MSPLGLLSSLVLAALGVGTIVFWNQLFGVELYFSRTIECLGPAQRDRLDRVLAAFRREPEKERKLAWTMGIVAFLAAAMLLACSASAPLTFAVTSVYMALLMLVAYNPSRDPSRPRTARLARRELWETVPALVVLGGVTTLASVATLIAFPQLRLASILVVSAMAVAFAVVWRIACRPSVLAGVDPLVEAAVDRRLRKSRALSIVALTCVSGALLPLLSWNAVPSPWHEVVAIIGAIAELSANVILLYQLIYQLSPRPFLRAFDVPVA